MMPFRILRNRLFFSSALAMLIKFHLIEGPLVKPPISRDTDKREFTLINTEISYYSLMKILIWIREQKRLLFVGFGLFLLILAALYLYRDDIFQSMQDPGEPFQTYEKPKAADYSLTGSWLAQPDLNADPFLYPAPADVFVIVPTTYKGGEHWNLSSDDTRQIAKLKRITRPNYVDTFTDVGRLFAPYYRQASLYTFLTAREDARRAQDLAYSDVRRAFDVFLRNNPPERPIVVVGYGQGALHGTRLVADYFQGPLNDKLVAAYLIDHPVPLDLFETDFQQTPPCETSSDIKCVIGFGAFYPSDQIIAQRFADDLLVRSQTGYQSARGRKLLCTNPLLWNRTEDYAPNRLHKGGVAAQDMEPDTRPAPLSKLVGAQCQDGLLLVDKPNNSLFRRPFKFGGKYRTPRSNLFYEDLRLNAMERVQTMITTSDLPKRVKKLDDLEVIDLQESPVTPIKPGE